ncbi:hypothetical protein [Kineococcus gypseus]|uniref:hypothetical protein n=1 Tax=Kineococcus gypseus TaxID=1637102 RepID=UPI003D7EB55D
MAEDRSQVRRSRVRRATDYLVLIEDRAAKPRAGTGAWWRRAGWMLALIVLSAVLAALVR